MAVFTLSDLYLKIAREQFSGKITTSVSERHLTSSDLLSATQIIESSCIQCEYGDRIILLIDNSLVSVAALLAAWHHGLVVVPVKKDMALESVHTIADDCNAKAIWDGVNWQANSNYCNESRRFQLTRPHRLSGSDLALIIYTSGSTGTPKGIMLTHNNVITAMNSISHYLEIHPDEKILGLSPLSFDYGLYQLLFAIHGNCSLVLYEGQFHPMKVLSVISQQAISLLPIVPAMATAIAKVAPILKADLSCLKKLTNTGGHLSESTIKQWKNLCDDLRVYAMYGLTECKRALFLEPDLWEDKMGSVGKPIPGLDARVFIENDQGIYREAEPFEVGELFVRGSTVMQAYKNDRVESGARIISGQYRDDNWLATGDLFCYDDDGFFYFKGRTKELIKQAGFCLFPAEIESKVEQHPNVSLCAVIGSQDRFGDEIALMFIQLHTNNETHINEIKLWLKTAIDNDYLPRDIRFIDEMALTINSKIDKNRLKQMAMEQ